jgi:hypothetical protein
MLITRYSSTHAAALPGGDLIPPRRKTPDVSFRTGPFCADDGDSDNGSDNSIHSIHNTLHIVNDHDS